MKNNNFVDSVHFESLYPPDSRFDEIEKLLGLIKTGNSAQVISLPGVGRSNILGLLSYNRKARDLHLKENQKWFHFVMMNFSEIKGRPLLDATKYMFLELTESLRERKMEEYKTVSKIFEESLRPQDELVLFQGLKKTIDYLSLEKELTVVFLFDRFEEYLPSLTPQFFGNLRVLRDRAKYRFSVVFPLNRPLEELIGHEILSEFYEFVEGNYVYLPILDKKTMDFRINYLEKTSGRKLDKKILESILELTGGNGKLTRICVEAYFSETTKKHLKEFLISKNRVKGVLSEIWKALTPYEQSLIIQGKAHESSHLVAVGLVKNNKITISLLESFAKEKQESPAGITYDESTKEIKKGDIIISEGLTSSEFRVLRFLVQNKEKILERDEIINAVWGDLSSTAGVSEQALDQLIFRVRKKIEENPNQPVHLQTIKGRGFKLTP